MCYRDDAVTVARGEDGKEITTERKGGLKREDGDGRVEQAKVVVRCKRRDGGSDTNSVTFFFDIPLHVAKTKKRLYYSTVSSNEEIFK